MSQTVQLTHANTGQEVTIYTDLVYAVLYLPANNCVAVMANGGAMVPVAGTVAEINQKIFAAKINQVEVETRPTRLQEEFAAQHAANNKKPKTNGKRKKK